MLSKWFNRSGGTWLFAACTVYLIAGMFHLAFDFTDMILIWMQIGFVTALALPLLIKPLGRWLNMDI